eukprot:scaffold219287_cov21-Prasinocladus_malaysianus.AAC.1
MSPPGVTRVGLGATMQTCNLGLIIALNNCTALGSCGACCSDQRWRIPAVILAVSTVGDGRTVRS